MYDIGSKLLNKIKIMHINSLICLKSNEGEGDSLRIVRGVRQMCVMFLWVFNV